MRLSKNFTLQELTKSQEAIRRGMDNTPKGVQINNLKVVCERILQPVREHYGIPFSPSSGFRSKKLNSAIKGSSKSQHLEGCAVDFEIPGVDNLDLARWIEVNLDYDQLILEYYEFGQPNSGWVHCSVSESPRREVLTKNRTSSIRGLPND